MKICLIGPGIMEIPPKGWGAVESLIWEVYLELKNLNQDVKIINTPNRTEIIESVNNNNFDFVHLFYDVFFDILHNINCKKIAISSAYPYIEQIGKHYPDGYQKIFEFLIYNQKYHNLCLSDKDLNAFKFHGSNPKYLDRFFTGANHNKYNFQKKCLFPNKSLYLAKIEQRKKQWIYQSIPEIDFVGKYTPHTDFNTNLNYLGEWSTDEKEQNTTNYANLIILSDGENGTPLVVKEALISGLGVVVSEYASSELDDQPFISVIPNDKLLDIDYVSNVLAKNRVTSCTMRSEIREYGIKKFSWQNLTNNYLKKIKNL
jgi:hypothetical protein